MSTLQVDIVSDVVCPWCVIGYHQLKKAIEISDADINIRWQPFELNLNMPESGQNLREHLAQKYGTTLKDSIAARKRLTGLGADLGFTFNYYDDMRISNTFKAHQLLHWAGGAGKQTQLKLALFEAYFTRQENIDDLLVLLNAVERAGLDIAEANALLRDGRYRKPVRKQQSDWLNRGIHAVPTFIFENGPMLNGAIGVDRFLDVLNRLAQEKPVSGVLQ